MSRGDGRLVASELGLAFRRTRNVAVLVVLAAVPVVIAVAIRVTSGPRHSSGTGGALLGGVTSSGVFVAFSALLVVQSLFLPLAVSVVAGDSVAGEAGAGTLRYLLTAPVARTRLLLAKFVTIVVWCAACVLLVAGVGVVIGLVLFPRGDVTLLSGNTVTLTDALLRLLGVCGYLVAMVAVVGALGLFVSTLTEVPLAAMAATLVVTLLSQVLDAVPQLSSIHDWLPTDYWSAFPDLLRDPAGSARIDHGLLVALLYVLVFGTSAWARFAGADVTS